MVELNSVQAKCHMHDYIVTGTELHCFSESHAQAY